MTHIPVLLHEVLEVLDVKPGDVVVDGTLGSGGHAREVIARIAPGGVFVGVDRDSNAIRSFKNSEHTVATTILQANYGQLPEIMETHHLPQADALLLDLGFSSDQLTAGSFAGRGFSFQGNEPLIMTYDDQTEPLFEQLRGLSEKNLISILSELGEETFAPRIAKSIVVRVRKNQMQTTGDLVAAVLEVVPDRYKHGSINPATRTFQALRIYVNKELEHLKSLIANLSRVVRVGGRVGIISFHSLEDRIVKQAFKELSEGSAHLITKKPITANEEELRRNPRSRSAKLRAIIL